MIEAAKITIAVLSALVLLGGIMGFVKAKSKVSLIAGGGSAVALGLCFLYAQTNARGGLIAGDVVCALLFGMFLMRLRKGAKFMPAGLMMILSGLAFLVVTLALVNA